MENTIVALISIALIVFGALTMSQSSLSSVDSLSGAWKEMEKTAEEMARTSISTLSTSTQSDGAVVEITLKNEGQTKLGDFENWDVIVQYYRASGAYLVKWLPYVEEEPGGNEWTVGGIYLDAANGTPEVFETGIFNPDEEMVVRIKLNPPVGPGTTNLATIATPNGICASATFHGP